MYYQARPWNGRYAPHCGCCCCCMLCWVPVLGYEQCWRLWLDVITWFTPTTEWWGTEEAAWWEPWGLDAAVMWGAGLAKAALGPPRLPSFPPPPPLPHGFPSFTSTGTATRRGELALCNMKIASFFGLEYLNFGSSFQFQYLQVLRREPFSRIRNPTGEYLKNSLHDDDAGCVNRWLKSWTIAVELISYLHREMENNPNFAWNFWHHHSSKRNDSLVYPIHRYVNSIHT